MAPKPRRKGGGVKHQADEYTRLPRVRVEHRIRWADRARAPTESGSRTERGDRPGSFQVARETSDHMCDQQAATLGWRSLVKRT